MPPRPLSRVFISHCCKAASKVKDGTRYMFKNHLLTTNILISATLSGVGDCLQQQYEKYKTPERKYNYTRTLHMSISGMTVGVFCHYWYHWLDRLIPGKTFFIALKKTVADLTMASPVTIALFFSTTALLEGSSMEDFLEELRCKAWRMYLADWMVWPPVQLLNFYVLPNRFRVLFVYTVSTLYDTYSSFLKFEFDCGKSKTEK